jgi:hypothetical protein
LEAFALGNQSIHQPVHGLPDPVPGSVGEAGGYEPLGRAGRGGIVPAELAELAQLPEVGGFVNGRLRIAWGIGLC